VLLDGSLHAVIASGQNIWTSQREHQEHVRRPDADALDLGQMRDHFFFRQFRHTLELQQAGLRLLGEIAQIRRLLAGQPDAAHFGIGEFENALRRQGIAGKGGESIENGRGRFAVQLLIEDRFSQRVKRGLAKLHPERTDALDNRGHDGVGFLQVVDRFAHRYRLLGRLLGRLVAGWGVSLAYGRTNGEFRKYKGIHH